MIVNKRYRLVALHKWQYICKVKAKTTKILKCIKTLFTVKTSKNIYNVIICYKCYNIDTIVGRRQCKTTLSFKNQVKLFYIVFYPQYYLCI